MRFHFLRISSAVAVLYVPVMLGQTKIDLKTQSKSVDFSGAGATKPAQVGSALPTSCSQGQFFFLTTAPAGQNVYGCSSTNTWALEGAAIPQPSLVPAELNHSGAVLTTDGTNPLWQTPAGDVNGAPSAARVVGLAGRPLSTAAPVDGQLLKFNGGSGHWEPVSLGGDVSGAPAALQVAGLLGRSLASVPPAGGQILNFDSTSGLWQPAWLAGDVTGSATTLHVTGLSGHGVSSAAPSDGQVLAYSASGSLWQPFSFGGDLSGAPSQAHVAGLQGRSVSSSAPTDGQLLLFDSTSGSWQPVTVGGDASGRPTALTVGGIRGKNISSAVPSDGQVFKFNGSANQWEGTAIGGDVAGSPASLTVTALRGTPLGSATPGDGQVMTYSTSARVWEPLSFAGDMSGSPPAMRVSGLQGRQVSNTAPLNGQVLGWNSSLNAWTPATVSSVGGGGTANYNLAFTSQKTLSILGTQHGLGTPNLIVACYDNSIPANFIEPSRITVDPSTFNVSITFTGTQSGRCVMNGSASTGGNAGSGVPMASQLGDLAVAATSSTVLTIGANCSAATPCNFGFGSATYTITSSATATVSAGTGTAFIYVKNDGSLNVGSSGLNVACSAQCHTISGITQFPSNSIPLFTWNAVSGAWSPTGGSDARAFLANKALSASAGILLIDSGNLTTIGTDPAVVPAYLTGTASLQFPAIANGSCAADLTLAVTGANVGDAVAPGWPALAAGVFGMMRVTSAGTVSVRVCNLSGSSVSMPSQSYTATIVRHP